MAKEMDAVGAADDAAFGGTGRTAPGEVGGAAAAGESDNAAPGERHASWMELFFDLVAVAGIGQLTHLLHRGPSLGDFGLYVVLYLAFWMVWACITMYGNIARDHTRVWLMMAAMLGLGLMVAAVAGLPDRHATTFAAVYVIVRMGSAQVWGRGRVVVDWPTAQLSIGVTPWVVSLWVAEPAKYWWWAAGLVIDLWAMFAVSGEKMFATIRREYDRRLRKMAAAPGFDGDRMPELVALHADPAHLGERLGLYVIIVLGEGVITVVDEVGGVKWNVTVLSLGFAAFVILAGLWALTLLYGTIPRLTTAPELSEPWQHIMLGHCAVTGALATLAAGLGLAIDHAGTHLTTGIGWALCGGAAAYFTTVAITGARSGSGRRGMLAWPIPCAIVSILLGAFAAHLTALPLICAIAVLVVWSLLWETWKAGKWRTGSGPARPRRRRRRRADTATT
ncbi:low temperature requirement protein A [Nocardia sp. NPDC088792]|uniref:low temperature requirement protein A n=1 Tax=Nocardia sp. NPDC088792 TaxID=3364332 RepID=UPI00382FA130